MMLVCLVLVCVKPPARQKIESKLNDPRYRIEDKKDSKISGFEVYMQIPLERKAAAGTRTPDQKKKTHELRRSLLKATMKDELTLLKEYEQIEFERKRIKKEMKSTKMTVGSGTSVEIVRKLCKATGINTQRKVNALVRFLAQETDYEESARETFKQLRTHASDYVVKVLEAKGAKYQIVYLQNLLTALQNFLQDHLDKGKLVIYVSLEKLC